VKTLAAGLMVLALSGCMGDWGTNWLEPPPPPPSAYVMTSKIGVASGQTAMLKQGMPGDTLTLSVEVRKRSNNKAVANALVEWRQSVEGLAHIVTPATKTNAAGIATTKVVIVRYFVKHYVVAHSDDAPGITFDLRPAYLY
jgi:hypothetical protein